MTILRKSERVHFENLDIKNLCDNRKLWASVQPLFSNKIRSNVFINLHRNNQLIWNEDELANIFHNSFINVVPNLEIKLISNLFAIPLTFLIQLEKLIKVPKNILVSLLFKQKASSVNKEAAFTLTSVNLDDTLKEVNRLDIKKITQDRHISTKQQFPNFV